MWQKVYFYQADLQVLGDRVASVLELADPGPDEGGVEPLLRDQHRPHPFEEVAGDRVVDHEVRHRPVQDHVPRALAHFEPVRRRRFPDLGVGHVVEVGVVGVNPVKKRRQF